MSRLEKATSGIKGLDLLLQNIRQGESLVWQINEIDDYKYFAQKLAKEGIRLGKNVIYFRFSDHPPLLEEQEGLKIVQMDSSVGFESFTVKVYQTLEKQETGTYYIFDCLSGLQSIWAADFMMRNFFMAICPTCSGQPFL